MASRAYHVRYFVRRVLTMFSVSGPRYNGEGFWMSVEDVQPGDDLGAIKAKTESRVRRAVESLDVNVRRSAETKDLLKSYKMVRDFNYESYKAAGRYGEIRGDQKTETCFFHR